MKKIIFILALILMMGCERNENKLVIQQINERWNGFDVVVIDSCEYLIRVDRTTLAGEGFSYFAHKGNCHFCAERQRKFFNEKLEK